MITIIKATDIDKVISNEVCDKSENHICIYPCEELTNLISYYNIVFPSKELFSKEYTLIPDASGTLSFSIEDNVVTGEIWGGFTKAFHLGDEPNRYSALLLIELRPETLHLLTGIESKYFKNLRLPLSNIDTFLNKEITKSIEISKDINDLITRLDTIFLQKINNQQPNQELSKAMQLVINNKGNIKVEDIVKGLDSNARSLNRLFNKHIGMSLKTYARIIRINYVIQQIQESNASLTSIAFQAGYSDQSHFIYDFKKICNTIPSYYFHNLSDFHNEIENL